MPHQWLMLSSSITEEYDHAGKSECCTDASKTVALEQGQADRGKAAAATKTRLVDSYEAPDRRPRSRLRLFNLAIDSKLRGCDVVATGSRMSQPAATRRTAQPCDKGKLVSPSDSN